MFSQIRNAVEQLAQQPMRALDEDSSGSRSQSLDLQGARSGQPLSSSQLAESAISSLRKSFVSQRANSFSGSSPGSPSKPSSAADTAPSTPPPATRPKSKLEERLRQATKVALSEPSSVSSTPAARPSRVASPSPMGRNRTKKPEPSAVSPPPTTSPAVTPAASEESKQLQQMEEVPKETNNTETAVSENPIDDAQPEDTVKPPTTVGVSESTTEVTETAKPTSNESEVVVEPSASLSTEGGPGEDTGTSKESGMGDPLGATDVDSISSLQMEEQQEAPEPLKTAVDEPVFTKDALQTSPGEEISEFHIEETVSTKSVLPSVPDATEEKEQPFDGISSSPAIEEATPSAGQENLVDKASLAPAVEDLGQYKKDIDAPSDSTKDVSTPEEDILVSSVAEKSTEEPATETIAASTEEKIVLFADEVLPPEPPISEDIAQPSEEGQPQPIPSLITITPAAIDQRAEVESLQARLKQIEQRFSGKF